MKIVIAWINSLRVFWFPFTNNHHWCMMLLEVLYDLCILLVVFHDFCLDFALLKYNVISISWDILINMVILLERNIQQRNMVLVFFVYTLIILNTFLILNFHPFIRPNTLCALVFCEVGQFTCMDLLHVNKEGIYRYTYKGQITPNILKNLHIFNKI